MPAGAGLVGPPAVVGPPVGPAGVEPPPGAVVPAAVVVPPAAVGPVVADVDGPCAFAIATTRAAITAKTAKNFILRLI